ncbi:MBL fold metallo-hydrolase [Prosthecobacter fluviatilis]|uniref:MBL fold metallo-hydrolase n=1 Tax=Prosthecobacter fluviatilis TaxID=445931 RepID=A0ABW0KYC2_9BACT
MATKATKPKTRKPAADYRVRIRMYQQGLGDCFLLTFPAGKSKQAHVMIDCGIVLGTSEPGKVMTQVAQDIKKTTKGKVDVLAITHEHWDHLSGFDPAQARDIFKGVKFGKLWLAWTEDEKNPLAQQLRTEREKKKKAAAKARDEMQKRGLTQQAGRMAGLLGFFGAKAAGGDDASAEEEEAGGGTTGALNFLKSHSTPTILETGGRPLSIPGVEGVRVYVLGPPLDRDALKKTNPGKSQGYALAEEPIGLTDSFLAAFDTEDELAQPFARSQRRPLVQLPERLAAAQHTRRSAGAHAPAISGIDGYLLPENQWRSIDDAWLGMGERLALQLDNATNNTSLVLAFEFDSPPGQDTRDVLLFVGDAQAGNWLSWDEHTWTVRDGDGGRRKVTAEDLLQRTIFYKVGHHGSHNATLREKGLERMTSSRLAAVIPVDTRVAHEVKGWEHMPLPAIRERLRKKCTVVFQSDGQPDVQDRPQAGRWQPSTEKFDVFMKNPKTKKVESVRKQNLYTDYYL